MKTVGRASVRLHNVVRVAVVVAPVVTAVVVAASHGHVNLAAVIWPDLSKWR